ncbi:MAG: hypothetical protein HY824_04295, partial [Acidobacteria bacterium]|nr:hypothetical protein [Acidobacteriota bacterium]
AVAVLAVHPRAQAPAGPSAFPPAEPARDLESALYKAADAIGMLRGPQERDGVVTFEFWASGSIDLQGRPCPLANYRASVRYPAADRRERFPVPAMRADFTCAAGGGQKPERHVEVVAGDLAWNETEPGGAATPALQSARERLLQVWTLPQGVVKAARLAGARAMLTSEGGKPVITFPLPAPLETGMVKATLDPEHFLFHTMPTGVRRYFSHRIERVETRWNNQVTVTTYADYADLNAGDYKSDALLPRRIVSTRNGVTLADLTLTMSQTYNPYVVMPVPGNVRQSSVSR